MRLARYVQPVVSRRRSPVAWSLVLPVAAAELLLLLATANRYGYHRDELYFRVAARHPAWGYDDQPALTPLLGRFSEWLFGETPRGLRVVSAVAIALVVVLVAMIARELGAGRTGQAVAALSAAASGAAMAVGHLLSTTTFDLLFWVTLVYLVTRLLGGGDERQWLLVGLVAGIGLENKHLVLLLLGALAVGCLLDRRWGLARSRWLWAGAAARARDLAPEPPLAGTARLAAARAREQDRRRGSGRLPGAAAAAPGAARRPAPRSALARRPLVAPAPRGRPAVPSARLRLPRAARAHARDRGEAVLHDGTAALAARRGRRRRRALAAARARARRGLALGAAIAVSAVVAALITLPLVPARDVHATPIPDINEDAIETIGWPGFAATVARVWNRLPAAERANAVVYATNYGEAGAIARYGPALGIPRAYSGHNAFWRFGRPRDGARPIVVIGYRNPARLRGTFSGCNRSATIDNRVDLDNEEQGAPVWTCAATVGSWSELWPRLRSLNP